MKKLVLFSTQVPTGTEPLDNALNSFLPGSRPVLGYLPAGPDPQQRFYRERKAYYSRLGMDLSVVLDPEGPNSPALLQKLWACGAIHLSGGNTFEFLRWLHQADLLEPLRRYSESGGVLIGVSGGAILLTKDISSARLCGDVPPEGKVDPSGLQLVGFHFVPHYVESDASRIALASFTRDHTGRLYACRDGEGLVVDGDHIRLVGNPVVFESGRRIPPL